MATKNEKDSYIFDAISHDARRKIIRLIGEKETATYKDLAKLGIEPGTLYFHLNILMAGSNPLIKKDEKKKYKLTPIGKVAYKLLMETEDKISWITSKETSKTNKSLIMVGEALGFKRILQLVYRAPNTYISNAVIFVALYGVISYYSNRTPFILMLIPYRLTLMYTIALAVFSWILTFTVSELLSRGIYKKSQNKSKLLIGTIFPLIPPTISMLIDILVRTLNAKKIPGISMITSIFFILSELWALWILTYAIGLAKEIKLTKAALIALIIGYTNLTFLQFLK